jgi:WD40 repeat protein
MSHPNTVQVVSFSPDGKYIATASGDQKARVWSTGTDVPIAEKSYRSFRAVVGLSPDARYLVIGHNGTVDVWQIKDENDRTLDDQDPRSREPVIRLAIRSPSAVAFSPNGEHLAAVGYDGSLVRVWDVKDWKVRGELRDGARAIAFDPTSNHLLLVASRSDRVGSASLTDLERRTPVKWHNITRVKKAAFSADGNYLATVDDLSAWVWRFNEEEHWQEISRIPHQGRVTAVAISRDGKALAVASKDGTARVWSMATQAEIARLTHDSIVSDVAFSADGKYLATAGQDRTARLWEPVIKQLSPRLHHPSEVKAVAFAPDGKFLASASNDGRVRIWETAVGAELKGSPEMSATMSDGEQLFETRAIAFSPNGRYVAISIANSTASVWDVLNRKEIAIDSWEGTDVIAISNDGQHFATA